MYFTDYNTLINYNLPSVTSSYMNIITNINNFSSLIDNPLRGVNGKVYSIIADVSTGILYIGGTFTLAGNITANNIVAYNSSTGIFSPLTDSGTSGEGTNNTVLSLAFDSVNSILYLGGSFTQVGGTVVASRIASWNILTNTFSPLTDSVTNDEGSDDTVRCLAIDSVNSILYLGGEISTVGGSITARYIALWNIINSTFSALTESTTSIEGINSSVYSLVVNSITSKLYVGGAFTLVGGTITANKIVSWDNSTKTFTPLVDSATGINGIASLDATSIGSVSSLAFNSVNNTLYVGGSFNFAGGKMNQFVTSYEFSNLSWNNLGAGIQRIDDVLNPIAKTLYLDNVNQILYVGGNFLQTSGINTNNVSVYNINNKVWSPLTENKGRYNGITNGISYNNVEFVNSICKFNDSLFIGGEFNMGGNVPVNNITNVNLNYILNTDGSKIFINNTSTILSYDSTNNKWNIIY